MLLSKSHPVEALKKLESIEDTTRLSSIPDSQDPIRRHEYERDYGFEDKIQALSYE
jgi:hypothetical protein